MIVGQVVGQMAAEAIASDWVRDERRKQNAVVLAVILACLLVAFFPRNERGLFLFPTRSSLIATIGAPVQTSLRSAIFGQPSQRSLAQQLRQRPGVAPIVEPDLTPLLLDDPWRDSLLADNPIQPGTLELPGLAELIGPQPPNGTPPGTRYLGDVGQYVIAGVPEPGTWAMMILGIGAVAYRMRAIRRRDRKRRAHERWRRSLVPVPDHGPTLVFRPAMPPRGRPPRGAMASLIGPWSATHCRNIGGFGPGADHLAHRPAPAREQQRH